MIEGTSLHRMPLPLIHGVPRAERSREAPYLVVDTATVVYRRFFRK